jgi:hypothetical protein
MALETTLHAPLQRMITSLRWRKQAHGPRQWQWRGGLHNHQQTNEHRDGTGVRGQGAGPNDVYCCLGSQVGFSYVLFSFFFIQLSSTFIIYRFYLTTTTWWPQPTYSFLHLRTEDRQTTMGCICTQHGPNNVYHHLGPHVSFSSLLSLFYGLTNHFIHFFLLTIALQTRNGTYIQPPTLPHCCESLQAGWTMGWWLDTNTTQGNTGRTQGNTGRPV